MTFLQIRLITTIKPPIATICVTGKSQYIYLVTDLYEKSFFFDIFTFFVENLSSIALIQILKKNIMKLFSHFKNTRLQNIFENIYFDQILRNCCRFQILQHCAIMSKIFKKTPKLSIDISECPKFHFKSIYAKLLKVLFQHSFREVSYLLMAEC